MLRRFLTISLVCLSAGSGWADCGPGNTLVLSCLARGGDKALDVCIGAGSRTISYSYGPPGGPAELSLSQPVAGVEHHPWPGIGRNIWETTVFHNAGYTYEVFISVDRMAEDDPVMGGVQLFRDGAEIARVECDAGTVNIGLWAVSEAKEALGYCWNQDLETWGICAR